MAKKKMFPSPAEMMEMETEKDRKEKKQEENPLQKHLWARDLIYLIWRAISWDNISSSRRMKIYDEFTSKIKSAASTNSIAKFTERLCAKLGIRSISGDIGVRSLLEKNDPEVLALLRDETQFVVLLMREIIEAKKEEYSDDKI